MPSSVYLQHKHKKTTGLVAALRAAKCFKCGGLAPQSDLIKGWCLACYRAWTATADPVMLAQATAGYSPALCLPAPSSRSVERITEIIIEPKDDQAFIPLISFLGNSTIGRMQAMWNLLKTMEILELKTTAEVFRLTAASHDTTHRCGLHAPVQKSSLNSFFSRLLHAENFAPLERDARLQQYLEWFIRTNRTFIFQLTPISATAVRSRQPWRKIQRVKWTPLAQHWPFLKAEASADHDRLLLVDRAIPKGIPEQWRQDMCQDLMVAVLSGEVSIENLRDAAPEFIKKVWREHPIKYAPLSLDTPPPWAHDDQRSLGEQLSDIGEDVLECEAHSHHDPFAQGFSMADILRDKNNGVLPIAMPQFEPLIDREIAEVYRQDRQPRGYKPGLHAATSHPERIRNG